MVSKEIKRDGIVTLNHYEQGLSVNESYQTANRVQSYIVTQEYVVPKKIFLQKIIDVLISQFSSSKKSLSILEPGMGPAAFSRKCIALSFLEHFTGVALHGADISRSMVEYASEVVNQEINKRKLRHKSPEVSFASGVNCINLHAPFYSEFKKNNMKFEAIVASQFEHYCPNEFQSPLALRLLDKGVEFSTKREFREFCFDLLVDGGVYFTIDDRLGENQDEHKQLCIAWDRHVVRQFTDESVLEHIADLNPALARNLRINYDPSRKDVELLGVAAQAREHRRNISYEEIETLSCTRRDFCEIFGEKNVYFMPHPSTETHPGFYLMWGVKNS